MAPAKFVLSQRQGGQRCGFATENEIPQSDGLKARIHKLLQLSFGKVAFRSDNDCGAGWESS